MVNQAASLTIAENMLRMMNVEEIREIIPVPVTLGAMVIAFTFTHVFLGIADLIKKQFWQCVLMFCTIVII